MTNPETDTLQHDNVVHNVLEYGKWSKLNGGHLEYFFHLYEPLVNNFYIFIMISSASKHIIAGRASSSIISVISTIVSLTIILISIIILRNFFQFDFHHDSLTFDNMGYFDSLKLSFLKLCWFENEPL